MAWATPQYDRSEINAAGRVLAAQSIKFDEYLEALTVINNWRASHAFPLNTLQMNLRRKAKSLDEDALVAQRIKRLTSISHKLDRFSSMKLSQMQDIGGCRAIVRDVGLVSKLAEKFLSGDMKHRLATQDDYILSPKESGYRGIHLVYRYYSDRNKTYNDLKIELQLRSQLQHSWATAVEVVGTLIQQALKSSQGEKEWLRFFQLMGSAIATDEKCPLVPTAPLDRDGLKTEIRRFNKTVRPIDRLSQYSHAIQVVENASSKAKYYLLDLRPSTRTLKVTGFLDGASQQASDAYLELERSLKPEEGDEAVLVSVESIESLRKAYPNYFLDTSAFVNVVRRWIR